VRATFEHDALHPPLPGDDDGSGLTELDATALMRRLQPKRHGIADPSRPRDPKFEARLDAAVDQLRLEAQRASAAAAEPAAGRAGSSFASVAKLRETRGAARARAPSPKAGSSQPDSQRARRSAARGP